MKKGTACITGATSGIGRALARRLAAQGYDLILTGRREEELAALATELPVATELFIGDLRDPAVCRTLADRIARCRDLSMLVHNAGYGHNEPFLQTPADQLREMGELHVQCTAELLRAGAVALGAGAGAGAAPVPAPGAGPGPAVILVSSLAAFMPAPAPAMYTATKAFQVALGRALQPDLALGGIRLQLLCPGFTHTDFHDRLSWDQARRQNRGLVRWMHADEVARRALARLGRQGLWSDPVYIPGFSNRLLLLIVRLLPRRVYLSMISRFRL